MTSAFLKSSVFARSHVHAETAFSKSFTLESFFQKDLFSVIVFIGYVWTEVASVKKFAFSNENRYYIILMMSTEISREKITYF